jgi:hypothetical protein
VVGDNAFLRLVRVKKGCSVERKSVVRHVDASSARHGLSFSSLGPAILY